MRPIHIGYTNPGDYPDDGRPEYREQVFLTESDLITHIHGVGATRSGKSKWLEWFCRELSRQSTGFTLIDPQGALARSLVSYFAYIKPRKPILYFDPSRTDFLIPFNPFCTSSDDVCKRVDKYVEATLKIWGVERGDATPRLERVLRMVYYLFATGQITFNEVLYVLSWERKALRQYVTRFLDGHPHIQEQWRQLLAYKKQEDFFGQVESTQSRLVRFSTSDSIRRIMSVTDAGLDFRRIIDEGAIVIVNLQESAGFSTENARLIGTLMISELWGAAREREKPPRKPYFLLVDEVQQFITPDIHKILDLGAGKGLHLGVFHQHLTQLKEQDSWTFNSIMTNAKTKVVFGGLTKPDALIMVDEIFANQIPYDEVKFIIEQTKFWPVYTRDVAYTRSRGGSRQSAINSTDVSGHTWNPWNPFLVDEWTASRTATSGIAEGTGESWQEGESDIPIFYPMPFREESSREIYSLPEQKERLADRLKEGFPRHFFIKRPNQKTIAAVTPFVKPFRISPRREEECVVERFIKPHGLSVREIEFQLAKRLRALAEASRESLPVQMEIEEIQDEKPRRFGQKEPPKGL